MNISSYVYCNNNPVKYVDLDGREVRIANNTAGALKNIAKIVATNLGQNVLNKLIGSNNNFQIY